MDLVLHKKLLQLQAENAILKEEIQKLQELVRPENIKNPEQYAKRIGQIAQIAAYRTTQMKPGSLEAKQALIAKGGGTDSNTDVRFSGSRTAGEYDDVIAKKPSVAAEIGERAVRRPSNTAADRASAEEYRKRLKRNRTRR